LKKREYRKERDGKHEPDVYEVCRQVADQGTAKERCWFELEVGHFGDFEMKFLELTVETKGKFEGYLRSFLALKSTLMEVRQRTGSERHQFQNLRQGRFHDELV